MPGPGESQEGQEVQGGAREPGRSQEGQEETGRPRRPRFRGRSVKTISLKITSDYDWLPVRVLTT